MSKPVAPLRVKWRFFLLFSQLSYWDPVFTEEPLDTYQTCPGHHGSGVISAFTGPKQPEICPRKESSSLSRQSYIGFNEDSSEGPGEPTSA